MNLNTERPPDENPMPKQPSQRELIEMAVNASVMEIIQLRRTLWLVLNKTGPQVVDDRETHPLWRMKATRLPDGTAQLEATQLPDPTVEQIALLAEKLEGTMTPLEDAMDAGELKDYPPAYIQMRLQNLVVRSDTGYWVDATVHKLQQQPTSEKN